jgi:hypothetical protein
MSIIKRLTGSAITLGFFAVAATAETDKFQIGHLVEWIIDVVGFNMIDFASSIQELFFLMLLLAGLFVILRRLKRR